MRAPAAAETAGAPASMPLAKFCARCRPEVSPPFSLPDHGPSFGTEKPIAFLAAWAMLAAALDTQLMPELMPEAKLLARCDPHV